MTYRQLIRRSFAAAAALEAFFLLLAGLVNLADPIYALSILFLTHIIPLTVISAVQTIISHYHEGALFYTLGFVLQMLFLPIVCFIRLSLKYGPRVEDEAGGKKTS